MTEVAVLDVHGLDLSDGSPGLLGLVAFLLGGDLMCCAQSGLVLLAADLERRRYRGLDELCGGGGRLVLLLVVPGLVPLRPVVRLDEAESEGGLAGAGSPLPLCWLLIASVLHLKAGSH